MSVVDVTGGVDRLLYAIAARMGRAYVEVKDAAMRVNADFAGDNGLGPKRCPVRLDGAPDWVREYENMLREKLHLDLLRDDEDATRVARW